MNPQTTSFIGVLFVLVGACATAIMLEMRGNPQDRPINKRLIQAHRILGYQFVVLSLIMLFLMINKVSTFQEEFSSRILLHIALGIILVPLLFIKIMIVRRFRRIGAQLFGLGVAVFLIGFVLNGITAGHYFLHQSDVRYVVVSEGDTVALDVDMGRQLVTGKCAKCHSLERVFKSFKSEEGWTKTVNRMAVIDAPNIRDFDAKQIIHYLVGQQEIREELQAKIATIDQEIGRTLVEQKCSLCHTLDRVYKASKDQQTWITTIETMAGYMDDPEFVGQEEKNSISEFLTTQSDE